MVLPRLNVLMPRMRYIHVTRNGLDMAYGRNQNQPRLWGRRFLGIDPIRVDPRYSLKYWVAAHQIILDAPARKWGSVFLSLITTVSAGTLRLDFRD